MRTPPAPSRTAFTLLEVLLAITILASMSVLIASMWGQSAAWGDDNTSDHERMRLQRVLALIRDQWSTRTATVAMDDFGQTVDTTHESITFTTTTPILHPDVAIVEASYRIERDLDALGIGPLGAWKLVYRERRIADPTARPDEQDTRRATVDSIDLLSACSQLTLERFGPETLIALPGDDDPEAPEAPQDKETDVGDEDADTPTTPDDDRRWRPYDKGDVGIIPAVRLVGEQEGERFSCLFIVGPLR